MELTTDDLEQMVTSYSQELAVATHQRLALTAKLAAVTEERNALRQQLRGAGEAHGEQ